MKKKMFTILNRKTKFTIKLHMFKWIHSSKRSKKSKKKERETDDS